jgi:LysM repeat protein
LQKWWLIASLFLVPFAGRAQAKLLVLGKCPECYVQYRLKPGETLESISALAGMPLAQLKAYNKISSADLTATPSSIRIPLNASNLITSKTPLPVFHVVEKGDNLYRLNLQYFTPGIPRIKEWNQLKSETLKDGDMVVVGYLGGNEAILNTPSVAALPSMVASTPIAAAPAAVEAAPVKPVVAIPQVSAAEGYYAAQFSAALSAQQLLEISGTGGLFKSITGWGDKRYYVLMNEVVPGSIVRITVDQVKYICARVLGPIPDNKPNKGLLVRLSNAAAAALGVSEMMFTATVNYFQ